MKKKNEIGNVYWYLTVLSDIGKTSNGTTIYRCKCECGNEHTANINSLRQGVVKSCGCLKKRVMASQFRTHGKSKTSEYKSWTGMKERCYNTNNKRYKDWGGRGIKICDIWLCSFENFLVDMGIKPTKKHSIERNDVNMDYCKENCRWATVEEQNDNKRNKKLYLYNGELNTIKEIAKKYDVTYKNLYQRVNTYKMSIDKAINL